MADLAEGKEAKRLAAFESVARELGPPVADMGSKGEEHASAQAETVPVEVVEQPPEFTKPQEAEAKFEDLPPPPEAEAHARFDFEAMFGVRQEELESIAGYKDLIKGQRALLFRNLEQVTLSRIEDEASTEYKSKVEAAGQKYKGKKLGARVGNALARGFVSALRPFIVGTEQKRTALELQRGGMATHGKTLELLIKGMRETANDLDVEVQSDGSLELLLAGRPEAYEHDSSEGRVELSPEDAEALEHFNQVASEFAQLPYEWSLPTAKKGQRDQYVHMKNVYEAARADILRLKRQQFGDEQQAALATRQIDYRVNMSQYLNSDPEVERRLSEIKSAPVWRKVLTNVVTERGMYGGLGFAGRAVTAGVLGWAAAPVVAAGMGGFMAHRRELARQREAEVAGRRGTQAESAKVAQLKADTRQAKARFNELSKELGGLSLKEDPELMEGERKTAYLQAMQALEQVGKLEFEVKQAQVEAGQQSYVEAKQLAAKLDKLVAQVEYAPEGKDKDVFIKKVLGSDISITKDNQDDLLQRAKVKLQGSLDARIGYTLRKLDDGTVNFGEKEEQLAAKYALAKAMGAAEAFAVVNGANRMVDGSGRTALDRVSHLLDVRGEHISAAKKKLLRNQIIYGATMGAGFATTGWLMRHGWEWFRTPSVVPTEVPAPSVPSEAEDVLTPTDTAEAPLPGSTGQFDTDSLLPEWMRSRPSGPEVKPPYAPPAETGQGTGSRILPLEQPSSAPTPETIPTQPIEIEINDKVDTFSEAIDNAVHQASPETQSAFIKRVLGDGTSVSDGNRSELLRRAVAVISVSNEGTAFGKGIDVENLVYEGNKVILKPDGSWEVTKAGGASEAKAVAEETLRDNAAKLGHGGKVRGSAGLTWVEGRPAAQGSLYYHELALSELASGAGAPSHKFSEVLVDYVPHGQDIDGVPEYLELRDSTGRPIEVINLTDHSSDEAAVAEAHRLALEFDHALTQVEQAMPASSGTTTLGEKASLVRWAGSNAEGSLNELNPEALARLSKLDSEVAQLKANGFSRLDLSLVEQHQAGALDWHISDEGTFVWDKATSPLTGNKLEIAIMNKSSFTPDSMGDYTALANTYLLQEEQTFTILSNAVDRGDAQRIVGLRCSDANDVAIEAITRKKIFGLVQVSDGGAPEVFHWLKRTLGDDYLSDTQHTVGERLAIASHSGGVSELSPVENVAHSPSFIKESSISALEAHQAKNIAPESSSIKTGSSPAVIAEVKGEIAEAQLAASRGYAGSTEHAADVFGELDNANAAYDALHNPNMSATDKMAAFGQLKLTDGGRPYMFQGGTEGIGLKDGKYLYYDHGKVSELTAENINSVSSVDQVVSAESITTEVSPRDMLQSVIENRNSAEYMAIYASKMQVEPAVVEQAFKDISRGLESGDALTYLRELAGKNPERTKLLQEVLTTVNTSRFNKNEQEVLASLKAALSGK